MDLAAVDRTAMDPMAHALAVVDPAECLRFGAPQCGKDKDRGGYFLSELLAPSACRRAASSAPPGRLRPKPRTGGSGVGGRWRPAARRTGAAPWRRRGRRGCGRWCSAGEGRWPAAWRMGGTRPRGDMTGGAAAGHGSGATGATARKLVACVGVKMRREAAAGWLRGFRFRNFRFLFFL